MKSFYQLMLEVEGQEPQLPGISGEDQDLSPMLPQKLTLNAWLESFDSLINRIEKEIEANTNPEFQSLISNFRYNASVLRGLIGQLQSASHQPSTIAQKTLDVSMQRLQSMITANKKLSKMDAPSAEFLDNFLQYNRKKFEDAIKDKLFSKRR